MKKRLIISAVFAFFGLALSGCGVELGWPDYPEKDQSEDSTNAKLRIFVSKTTTNGEIGSGGIGQADSICAQDDNKPNAAVYRALLADGSSRIAAPGSQTAWVLAANRTYIRPDGTEIGKTNSAAVLPFPLRAAIDVNPLPVWTGINGNNWSTGLHCVAWANGSGGQSGAYGIANRVNLEMLLAATDTCNTARHLYCVEQPAAKEE